MVFHSSFPACICSSVGAVSNVCNNMTGSCFCQPYVTGRLCDRCEENAFNYTKYGCMPCNCNSDGSNDLQCDSVSHLYALCHGDCRTNINIGGYAFVQLITLGPVNIILEKFENGGFTLKPRQSNVFRPHYAGEI